MNAMLLLLVPFLQPQPGLAAWWSFEEYEGALTPDRAAGDHAMLVHRCRTTDGIAGMGVALQAARSVGAAGPSRHLPGTGSFSAELWFRLGEQPQGVCTLLEAPGAWLLRIRHGEPGLVVGAGAKLLGVNGPKRDWKADAWYHLAATGDGKQLRLYVDGVEVASKPARPSAAAAAGVFVGGQEGKAGVPLAVDEVRIWSRALLADEVRAARAAGLKAFEQPRAEVPSQGIGENFPVLRKPARAAVAAVDGTVWLDAEDFADYGGWTLDTQFVHLVGSGYLLAATVDKPVADARTTVVLPAAGKYRLWVRSKNWLAEFSPGRFQVLVGGKPSAVTFGGGRDAWGWQSGGDFDLAAGTAEIVLRDVSAAFARCDAIVLSADPSYTPPNDLAGLDQQRVRLAGHSLDERLAGSFDVVVVGGGAAGSCAAIAAARGGAKTALIQSRPVLGGNASIELGVPINGAGSLHSNARESGIIEEAGRIKARYGYPKMSEAFERLARAEPNLSLFLNEHVVAAEMRSPTAIRGVRSMNALTGQRQAYRGKYFLDCTGDGWLGYYAGAKFRSGRESREEFGEDLAPPAADALTMSGCLMGRLSLSYRAEPRNQPVAYRAPAWAARLPAGEALGRNITHFSTGDWWLEHPGDIDNCFDAERSRDELLRISFGYWDHIKNSWPRRAEAAHWQLVYVPHVEAKRESRRLVGDYILKQSDVQNAVLFDDRVSYGGWPLDVHHPQGIFSGKEGPFFSNAHVPIYSIPYRSLYSVNIDNLLFAGRLMSVTHIALGTVRVQGTLAATGQAAGTAAALCARHNVSPRQLGHSRLAELQQTLLKADQTIPEMAIGANLATAAKVTASSAAEYDEFGEADVRPEDRHPLNMPRGVMFSRGLKKQLGSVVLWLSNTTDKPIEVALHLAGADRPGDFAGMTEIAVAKATVPAARPSKVEFVFNALVEKPQVCLWLPKTAGVGWTMMERAPHEACRGYGGPKNWRVHGGQFYAFATRPALQFAVDYSPQSVVDGVARIRGPRPHLWASAPGEALPQWVELELPRPARLNAAYLTFDTDLNAPFHTVALPRECVRDYELSYHDGKQWTTLATVTGNYQRRRVHRFAEVQAHRLRLTVTDTNGHPQARVFEIQLYRE